MALGKSPEKGSQMGWWPKMMAGGGGGGPVLVTQSFARRIVPYAVTGPGGSLEDVSLNLHSSKDTCSP